MQDGLLYCLIEEDLAETAVADFAAAGLVEIEALLAKHAAFAQFLVERGVR